MKKKLLLIVDPQYDFLEGGKLAVSGAMASMDSLAEYLEKIFANYKGEYYSNIVITCDWHPMSHCSFISNGGEWPEHCVQHTHGASIHEGIYKAVCTQPSKVQFLTKGDKIDKDEYSIFQNNENGKYLLDFIKNNNFDEIEICGVAGNVCVLNTIKDLCENNLGNKVTILEKFTPSLDDGSTLRKFAIEKKIEVI